MALFARVVDNTAVDVSDAPEKYFHPILAAEFEVVPSEVGIGWTRGSKGLWSPPQSLEPAAPEPTAPVASAPLISTTPINPAQFKLLFNAQERAAIKQIRATDPLVDDFFLIIEDVRFPSVDLTLQSTQDVLQHLQDADVITLERRLQVQAGQLQ